MARVSLVTGGSGALGQAITHRLLADGAVVCVPWIVEHERERLEASVAVSARARLTLERCDVGDDDAMAALAERTLKAHGRIDVLVTAGGFIAYIVAKAGVIAFVQALAQETRGRGATVNAVLPSTMDTPANRTAMPDVDPRTWTPVTAVADAIGYLAGESAGHITGTLLAV